MKNLVGVLPDRAGATVRSALRHPGQITYGLYGTKYKPTFCHGDNLRKYTINQFSWFVSGLPAMGNYLENKQVPINKCRGASLGAPQKGGHRGPPLRINKSIFMVVGDP
jgi:hypothetical protein